jgi:hypothetical protein
MEHERAIQNLAVESYLLGEMSPAERESFEEHYFECAVCAEDLRAAAQFMEDAKVLMAGDSTAMASVPARVRAAEAPKASRWDWLGWLRPQAAAAMIAVLVVIVGVQTFSTIPALHRQVNDIETPKIVKSIVLRPLTRGDASTVRAGAGEPVVLVFDPPESPELSAGSPLKYVVKAVDGRPVFELAGVAPNPGERITLSIPRLNAPPGDYTLVVEGGVGSANPQRELGQYPFKLEH